MVRVRRFPPSRWWVALILSITIASAPAKSLAQVPPPEPTAAPAPVAEVEATAPAAEKGVAPPASVGRASIMALVSKANPMLWALALCSVVTLGYTLERMVALRRNRVIPRDFVNRFLERLSTGKLDRDRATELCRSNDSPMARVFGHVIRYWGQPAATVRIALDHDASREVADLKRNIRVLNGTATLAPLLGLLGTVIGMIQSFDAIGGRAGGSKSEALAQGISLALVSTAIGLAVAVASVISYYYLLNRADVLVRDMDDHARNVIDQVSAEALRPLDRRADHPRIESRSQHSHPL